MAFSGKIALFVEGSVDSRTKPADSPLGKIWLSHITTALNLAAIDRIIPIDKKAVTLLDRSLGKRKPVSGVGTVPLDERIRAELSRNPFDAAVVAWDLQPPWDPTAKACRKNETINMYYGLATSTALPEPWRVSANARYNELKTRKMREYPAKLEKHAVLAVCMEPVFEALLIQCERSLKQVLGVRGGGYGWPSWNTRHQNPETLIQLAIDAAGRTLPVPHPFKVIRGDMKTAKNHWGEYLLRHLLADSRCRAAIMNHSIAVRLTELLSTGSVNP